jgi:hypothetical protein
MEFKNYVILKKYIKFFFKDITILTIVYFLTKYIIFINIYFFYLQVKNIYYHDTCLQNSLKYTCFYNKTCMQYIAIFFIINIYIIDIKLHFAQSSQ